MKQLLCYTVCECRHVVSNALKLDLMPDEAPTSFAVCDLYRYILCESGIVNDVTKSRTEYLLPTHNIIAFDLYFNLTKKFNLTGRL